MTSTFIHTCMDWRRLPTLEKEVTTFQNDYFGLGGILPPSQEGAKEMVSTYLLKLGSQASYGETGLA